MVRRVAKQTTFGWFFLLPILYTVSKGGPARLPYANNLTKVKKFYIINLEKGLTTPKNSDIILLKGEGKHQKTRKEKR